MAIANKMELEPLFFGETTVILAKRGFGKSYTARVKIEEGIKLGVPFVIIDPQDAYLNLKEFAYIDATKVKSARTLAQVLTASHKNTVIQMKRLSIENQNKFLKVFLEEYKIRLNRGIQCIVIDEFHKYCPEGENTESKGVVRGFFQENRSDGVGVIAISQRPARMDKTCLSQADHLCIGRVTSFRDLEAVKNYIDNVDDLAKIKKLNKGEFYFCGYGLNEPTVAKIRKAESEHSGSSPQHLLTEDNSLFQKNLTKFYKEKKTNMEDNIATENNGINKFVPSVEGFKDLAILGAKVSLGVAAGGLVGSYVGMKMASPISAVSSRTLGSAATTVALYTGYRFVSQDTVKDVLKYAAAGSAVFTLGSLTYDLVRVSGVKLPNWAMFALSTATGASPMVVSKAQQSESGSNVDLNTEFR